MDSDRVNQASAPPRTDMLTWRAVRWTAIVTVVVSAFLPLVEVKIGPTGGPRHIVPSELIAGAAPCGHTWDEFLAGLWAVRRVYPYLFVPVWAVSLAVLHRCPRSRLTAASSESLAYLSAIVVAIEASYLYSDYVGVLSGALRWLEIGAIWLAVIAILYWRRRGRGWIQDPLATISAQAALGLAHVLSFVVADLQLAHRAIPLTQDRVVAVLGQYRVGYVVSVLGFALMAVVGYVVRDPHEGCEHGSRPVEA